MFATGESNSKIYEFSLTNSFDLGEVFFINDFYVGDKADNPSDIFVKPDQSRFFICGGTQDRIFQYEMISLAKGVATLTNGTVTNINIIQPGAGYTVAPTITISAPFPSVQSTAVANVTGGIVTSITLTNGGFGYISNPSVSITAAPTYRTAVGFAVLNVTTGISTVAIVDGGANYILPPTITFGTPDQIQMVFPGDTYSQNNNTWRWNGTQWQENLRKNFNT